MEKLKDIEIRINKNGIALLHSKGFVYITKEELLTCLDKEGKPNEVRLNMLYDYKYNPIWMAC